MAYCRNCGAYVPDSHTKCLACGLEQQEEQSGYGSGSAAQYDPRRENKEKTEELRQKLHEQRRKQQEENRKWAEAERQRRQQQQEEQEKYDWQSEDAEYRWKPKKEVSKNKTLAALSYLWILFLLPFLLCKEDKYAIFHAKQGAVLFFASMLGKAVGSIFGLGWLVTLMQLYLIYKGMTNASAGIAEPLPYIGNLFSKQD